MKILLKPKFYGSIDRFQADDWDRLLGSNYPFLRHSFLQALEQSGCVCAANGWRPQHLAIEQDGQLVAVLPLYEKYHSWGEYVFDWSWADAYQRLELPYYPKLLSAVPFTPATGPRLLIAEGVDHTNVIEAAFKAVQQHAADHNASGFHLLFPDQNQDQLLQQQPRLQRRTGTQFHWHNRNYDSFEGFLAALNSRRRKSIRTERRRVSEQPLTIERIPGPEISASMWDAFYPLYHRTYLKRSGGTGYLNKPFFQQLGSTMAEQIMLAVARDPQGEMVAAALFFHDSSTLYGRYWGAAREFDALHFELCYYQGIEYAIERELDKFDAGAQGEHKIKRGFEPVETCSYHWLADQRFNDAIKQFLKQEKIMNKRYIDSAREHLPYKR